MNVLVVNPANKPFTNRSILAEPLDVLQIATIINEKIDNVKIIDMDVNRMDNNINEYLSDENIVVFVYDYQLPLHTTETIQNIFETIHNTNKPTKFIMIGKTSTHFYQKFLDNGIDIIIRGIADEIIIEEYEGQKIEIITDVIENIDNIEKLKSIPNLVIRTNENIYFTEKKKLINDFSKLPMVNRDLLDISKYMETRTIITSRGCVGTCKFCTTPYYFGKWNGRNVIDVVNEIETLITKYNTKKIIFLDDNATVNKQRMIEICKEIEKRNIKCLFGALCSIKCYDKELLEYMYKVGFRWVHFGIETGSERLLKLMNKEMDINYIKQVIEDTKKIGYRIRTSFILDYPSSTKEDIIKTKELILSIMPHELRLHYLAYRVGTPIYNENKDILNKTQYIHSNKPNIENNDLTIEIDNLIKELEKENYNIVSNDIDWGLYENADRNTKIAAFTPIKYGMCWYE